MKVSGEQARQLYNEAKVINGSKVSKDFVEWYNGAVFAASTNQNTISENSAGKRFSAFNSPVPASPKALRAGLYHRPNSQVPS